MDGQLYEGGWVTAETVLIGWSAVVCAWDGTFGRLPENDSTLQRVVLHIFPSPAPYNSFLLITLSIPPPHIYVLQACFHATASEHLSDELHQQFNTAQ